ncbi:MAG: GNAT family N-acetyltransferase [Clostridia bacterium]|nr:GNAT family N-acetyltransferase [Clostridia bacterium]
MVFNLFHPNEDLKGNQKENIFIVTSDEGSYIGSGYVYPKLTPVITPSHPLNIFMEMHIDEELMEEAIGLRLFHALEKRAMTISQIQTKPCLLYYGSDNPNHPMLSFLKKHSYGACSETYLMLKSIPVMYYDLKSKYDFILSDHVNDDQKEMIMSYHNHLFINPLSDDDFKHFSSKDQFRNLTVYDKHELIGNMMLYVVEDHGISVGKIENLFITPKYQRMGVGELCLKAAYNFFNSRFIPKVSLEVWSENENALSFYKKHGFEIIKSTEFYNGKFLK